MFAACSSRCRILHGHSGFARARRPDEEGARTAIHAAAEQLVQGDDTAGDCRALEVDLMRFWCDSWTIVSPSREAA